MAYETFEKVEGIIQSINRSDSCCSMVVSLISDSNIVNVVVSGETDIIDNVRLRPGMRIAAFYDTNLPTPAVYPPRYQAELVTSLRRGQQVMLDYFDDTLTSADGSLQLNIGPTTNVVTKNGQQYTCSPENTELLVYYTNATFSIPAQTTPQKVVVLCQY
nr:hypothetical protein [uncultured Mediterraneibacter sp.]